MSQLAQASQKSSATARSGLEWTVEYSRAMVSALPEASVLVLDRHETVLVAEGNLLGRHGYPASTMVGRRLDEILPGERLALLRARYRSALTGRVESFDHLTADGALCWIQATPMYAGGETPVAVTAVIQDVSERHRMTSELQREREMRRTAEEIAGVGHWEADPGEGTVALSDGALRLLALEADTEPTIAEVLAHVNASDRRQIAARLTAGGDDGPRECECECDLHPHGGERRRVLIRGRHRISPDGRTLITGTVIDITELRAAEQARRDSEALFAQGFDSSPIGMALVTPDEKRFLRVNDALCGFLRRSREELLELTCNDVTHPEDCVADEVAREAMLASVSSGYQSEKRYVRPDGTFVWGAMHVTPVYSPKGEVRAFFSQIVDLTASKEREAQLMREAADLEQLAALRAAIAADRLVLHAQPIVDVAGGAVIQQELLVRLLREDGTIVPPGEFLPIAERHGCITEIDAWVVERAMELAAAGAPVEVNLSAASVGHAETLEVIRGALERTGADPSRLVFEVTETALMADLERGRSFATALRELGCRFALDDFGTGYGTLTYLKHIPIDYIKIDMEFVRDLPASDDDQRIVRAIVTMAQEMGKRTIAEGVEDAATLELLRRLGVDHAQGYHIGRPAPVRPAG